MPVPTQGTLPRRAVAHAYALNVLLTETQGQSTPFPP